MLYSIWEDTQEWLEQYHMRSISEMVNSMVIARFGAPLRKRLDARKVTETRLKNVAHKVRRIGYLEIIDGIVPHWSRKAEKVNFVPRPILWKSYYIVSTNYFIDNLIIYHRGLR